MKRKLLLLLALMAIGLSNVWAYYFNAIAPSGQWLFYNIVNGNAQVTYNNTSGGYIAGALVIPASVTYAGTTYSVTSIGERAFSGCSGLTSVTIPNSVTTIGNGTFYNCSGLTSVTIPNSVTVIGDGAFQGCSGLTSVTIPNSVTSIGDWAFYNCSGLTSVTIGNSVTSIGDRAFYGCSGLTSVTIPNSVTTIGNYAFYGCSGLTSVTIPNSVTTIGNGTFYNCSGLTSVTIPNSVTSIGEWTFYNCSGLTGVTIPNSVTTIGSDAFQGCSGLTSVTIPNSVTSIGVAAFHGCSGLTNVVFNAQNCTTTRADGTGYSVFSGCSNFASLTIGDSVRTISAFAFSGCSSLTNVTIGNSVTSIGDYAFSGCSGLTSVTIPNSVTSIGDRAFYGCSGLTSVTIPNSVTSIGERAFDGCSGLTSVTIPNSVTSIGERAFDGCSSLTSVTIPNSVTTIGSYTFHGCSGLTSVTIPNSVTSIGDRAFYGCSGLTSVTIPNSVTSIGDLAFYYCSRLTSVTMEGVTPPTLGSNAFTINDVNRKFYVPCGAYDNYYNASNGWLDYCYYLSDPMVDIDVVLATEAERGSVVIIPLHWQEVRCDSTVVVCATANYGYHFDHWSTGSTQAQDTIAIRGDTVITAYFAKNQYAITLLSDDESMGSVNGGGTFDYLDTIALTATPMDHYHFVRWNNGNRENPRQLVVTQDHTLTAYFAIDTHRVTVVSNDPTRGMVTSSGSEFEYLSPCTVTATAYTGFTFAGWSNGVTANPYTFAVLNDVELTAMFISENEQIFTVTVVSDNPTMGSVSGGGMAMSGGEVTIHAVANEGYHFVRWNDNNTNADRTVTVTADATYTAYFAANQTQGVENVETMAVVKVMSDCITIEGAEGEHVMIFDVTGRVLVNEPMAEGKRFRMPRNGVYMVKVGNHPAQKVVVIR